jgi:type VII secretion integral membrane protein EccD
MTSAIAEDLCRITVIGPQRRVDLAVPASSTVAALMPVLLWHTLGRNGADLQQIDGAWILQRLGQAPFDPNGTPESLDWLEGEELYLRAGDDPLPELDYDDLADGISTVVNRRNDRWQPHYRRYLFLGLSAVVLALLAVVLTGRLTPGLEIGSGLGLAAVFLLSSVLIAYLAKDWSLALLFGLAAAGYAGVTALDQSGEVLALVAAAAVAVILIVVQRLWVPGLPSAPFLGVLGVALAMLLVMWLSHGLGLRPVAAAGIAAAALFASVIFAPKIVLRAARLRGPQLPKTGEELKFDIAPHVASDVDAKARDADVYLSVLTVCVALVLPFLLHTILGDPGWAPPLLVGVLSSALLLRSRTFYGVWQRVSMVAAGSAGYLMLILAYAATATGGSLALLLGGLLVLVVVLVLAARRPWPRRLLPIWEYTALILDVITGITMVPLLLQVLHAYGWARGLLG